MHEDFYRAPLDLAVTEDAVDVIALQIAEPSFAGIAVTPEGSKRKAGAKIGNEEEGEESQPVEVAYTEKNLSLYEDPIEEEKTLTVEEFLEINSRDSKAVRAFKFIVNEMLSRVNHSKPSACRMRHTSGYTIPDSLPSIVDFQADVALCVKRSCSQSLYEIFCKCVETQFELWPQVPESVRSAIMERAGNTLIARGIVRRGNTRTYWNDGFLRHGPRTKDTRSIRVV